MTDSALAVRGSMAVVVTAEQTALVRTTVAKDATDDELALYFYDCQRRGVHPLDKLIHFTKRGGKYTPVTSIDFMRARAADSGEYAGNDDADFTDDAKGAPTAAKVTVYRLVQGQRVPFAATARWSEYYPGDQSGMMWRKMPHTMLGKCAEALALRKGFPQQVAGLYTVEEMDQATGEIAPRPTPVVRQVPTAPRPTPKPAGPTALAPGADDPFDTFAGDSVIDGEAFERPAPVAPKPPREKPPVANPAGAYDLFDIITKMSKRETKNPGTFRYGFNLGVNKKWVNTFNSDLAQQAEIWIELKTPLVLTVHDGQYGTDVLSIVEDIRTEVV